MSSLKKPPKDILLKIVYDGLIVLQRDSKVKESLYPSLIVAKYTLLPNVENDSRDDVLEDIENLTKQLVKGIVIV